MGFFMFYTVVGYCDVVMFTKIYSRLGMICMLASFLWKMNLMRNTLLILAVLQCVEIFEKVSSSISCSLLCGTRELFII